MSARKLIARKIGLFRAFGCTKINGAQIFRPEFDDILQYFSPPQFYTIHLCLNNAEKENATETCKAVLVSQIKS